MCNLSQLEELDLRGNKLSGKYWRVGHGEMASKTRDRDEMLYIGARPLL